MMIDYIPCDHKVYCCAVFESGPGPFDKMLVEAMTRSFVKEVCHFSNYSTLLTRVAAFCRP